ncbi:MAG: hypothetical protein JSV66_02655 [Trueperaceae bacterium]|nr:MAG: hypothetical protein JSV66_02655 [Trueperaceae bacterium]
MLLSWRSRTFPIDWYEEFGSSGDLHLEIGFGDGRYTVARAIELPDARFVGLEISSGSVQRALRRLVREKISNVRVAKVGAGFAVQQFFAPYALSSVTVNFPDPWPKERHAKNRLLQRDFFTLCATRLRLGGELLLATDHLDYLEFAKREALASGVFRLVERLPPPGVFETKYALKWKIQGRSLYYQVFENVGGQTPEFPHLERPSTMPHALLKGRLSNEVGFEKLVCAYADGYVIVHEVLRSFSSEEIPGERWLFRVTIDEPELKQHLLVVANHRKDDEVIVRLEPFGDPIVTPSVRGAVHVVTEWLAKTVSTLVVTERNY